MEDFMKLLREYMVTVNKINESRKTGTLVDLTLDPIVPNWNGFFNFLCMKATQDDR